MAEIKPFKGIRFTEKAGKTGDLCCPPYDIVSAEEKELLLQKNPYNIIRLELPVVGGSDDDAPYKSAAADFKAWLDEEIMKRDEKDCIYVYEMEFTVSGQRRKVKGFIALVKLEPFSSGIILPHEETLSKAKADRFNLMKRTGANFSHVYSLYTDEERSVSSLIDKISSGTPDEIFEDKDGVIHRLRKIDDPAAIAEICEKMSDKKLYIADGHHRYETALNYQKYVEDNLDEKGTSDYVTMLLVDLENEGLTVFPTHRILKALDNFNYNYVCEKCAEHFFVTPYLNREKAERGLESAYNNGKKAFVLFTGDNNYTLLEFKENAVSREIIPNASEALRGLDVTILHTLILERIFGIDKENMANQTNLSYTRSADEAISEVDGKRANCCFLLNPTKVDEIKNVAAAGEKMPQKSTYFYPKPTTGLVINKIF